MTAPDVGNIELAQPWAAPPALAGAVAAHGCTVPESGLRKRTRSSGVLHCLDGNTSRCGQRANCARLVEEPGSVSRSGIVAQPAGAVAALRCCHALMQRTPAVAFQRTLAPDPQKQRKRNAGSIPHLVLQTVRGQRWRIGRKSFRGSAALVVALVGGGTRYLTEWVANMSGDQYFHGLRPETVDVGMPAAVAVPGGHSSGSESPGSDASIVSERLPDHGSRQLPRKSAVAPGSDSGTRKSGRDCEDLLNYRPGS